MTSPTTLSRAAGRAEDRRRRSWTTSLLENRSFRLEQIAQLATELDEGGTPGRRQVAEAVLAAAQLSLQQTHDALARLATGGFGDCEACGRPIELERLDVLPMAARCTSCEYRAEHAVRAAAPVGDRVGPGGTGRS